MNDSCSPSEAACLLQGGVLYLSRVGLARQGSDSLIFAGFKRGAFSLYFDDAPIFHFDLDGRWQRAFVGQTHYLKALDTSIQAVDRVRDGANMVLRRRRLGADEAQELDREVRETALCLLDDLRKGRLQPEAPPAGKAKLLPSDDLAWFLERIVSWDEPAWDGQRARYGSTYGPLPLLPPDCQHAVILQATIGKVAGGVFGRGGQSPHLVRTIEEFGEHLREVTDLLAGRLQQSRIAFLGCNEALRQDPARVEGYLDAIAEALPIGNGRVTPRRSNDEEPRLDGIHAFVDRFESPRPGLEALRSYRDKQLTAISLGIVSGDPAIRERLGARWGDEDLRAFVGDLREAGFRISFLTLSDLGGPDGSREHVSRTASLIQSLGPSRSENVFLLKASEVLEPAVAAEFSTSRIGGLVEGDEGLKQALSPLRERGVKVLDYSPEKQWA